MAVILHDYYNDWEFGNGGFRLQSMGLQEKGGGGVLEVNDCFRSTT